MKKRTWIVGGSVGAGILLVLMSFNSVVASNVNIQSINKEKKTVESSKIFNNFYKNIFGYPPGWFLGVLFAYLISWFLLFSFNHPPSS
ncbi:MAG: hypothetical protein NT038_03100 [Euryarchaeota archaeon]|nr:hypothetical protein [Euryarchaeota archaeon]